MKKPSLGSNAFLVFNFMGYFSFYNPCHRHRETLRCSQIGAAKWALISGCAFKCACMAWNWDRDILMPFHGHIIRHQNPIWKKANCKTSHCTVDWWCFSYGTIRLNHWLLLRHVLVVCTSFVDICESKHQELLSPYWVRLKSIWT